MLDLHPRAFPFLLLAAPLVAGCSAEDALHTEPDAESFRALTDAKDEYFEVVTWPREATGPAARSAGHLILRVYARGVPGSGVTGPANPPNTTDKQGTCGVTFVSPTIAVTAGHCLARLNEYDEVEVRTPRVSIAFAPTPTISGTYPDYVHSDAPGHSYDRYICAVRSRCYSDTDAGPPINCDITASDVDVPLTTHALDIGILECEPVGTRARHDYLNVTDTLAVGDGLALSWFHELYEPPAAEPWASDFVTHYIEKESFATNYHYHGGGERHQMLPLASTDYYGDRWEVVNPPSSVIVDTNLRGCHGTSGSGVLKKNSADYPELVGPVARGYGSINAPPLGFADVDQLCHDKDADPDTTRTMTAMHPDITRHFVEQYMGPSCAEPDSFPNRLMYWLVCDRLMIAEPWWPWDFRPPVCPWCRPFARFDASTMQAMVISTATPTSLALRPNELGKKHRASVRVWTNAFPTTVELRMGTTTIATHTLTGQTEEWNGNDASAVLSASFVSDASTSGPLTVATMPGSAAQAIAVSQVQLVQDGETAAFDTMDRRVGYAVHAAKDPAAQAVLATFAGSPTGGFAAVLEPGERMIATGLALTADTKWHVKLTGDATALRCGLVFPDGSETVTDCATNDGGVVLDGTGEEEPVGLFVQHTVQPQGLVSIHDLIVTEVDSCELQHDTCTAGAALDEGCDACVDAICNVDPYCCGTAWDGICVGEVLTVCDEVHCDASKGACTHSVCEAGAKLVSGCDAPPVSPSCVGAICGVDPYCCATAWDGICVGEVASVCALSCG